MSQLERQQKILNILKELDAHASISVKELAAMFYASESSIRRDIMSMERRGLVTHIYGGVMLTQYQNTVMPANIRDSEHSDAKEQIAKAAAKLIKNGDTILLDSSSTTRRILKYIGDKKSIRIITNNQRIFTDFGKLDVQFYCTGGTYNQKNHNFLGLAAEEYVRRTSADIMFFSSLGLSLTGEINDVSEEEISIRRVMLSRAKRKIFLCDSSKIGVSKLMTLCSILDVDNVICDRPELIDEMRKNAEAAK